MKTLYTGKWIYTGNEDSEIIEDFAMMVEDDKISWIKAQAEVSQEEKADNYVNLGDKYLVAGFIDSHVHILGGRHEGKELENKGRRDARAVCQGVNKAKQLLDAGIVACRDLGSYDAYVLGIRDSINAGDIPGPRVLACGHSISARGGHGYGMSYEVDGEDSMRGGVRQVIKDGADVVKIMVSGGVNSPGPEPGPCELTWEEIKTGIETAHAWGRKVAVHTHGNTAIRRCVEADVDSIEHGVFLSHDIMDMMKEKGTYLVPTLSAPYYAVSEGIKAEPDNPDHEKSRQVLQRHRDALKDCQDKGVNIAMGSDAGTPYNLHINAPYELVLMVEAGLTPKQSLDAATKGSAKLLGIFEEFGSLEPGKKASFLALEGNPLEDIKWVVGNKTLYLDGKKI